VVRVTKETKVMSDHKGLKEEQDLKVLLEYKDRKVQLEILQML
tara:strand:- start:302 stop:430 length:129 start_codon:yes stop_codon:yes gene_type:complete